MNYITVREAAENGIYRNGWYRNTVLRDVSQEPVNSELHGKYLRMPGSRRIHAAQEIRRCLVNPIIKHKYFLI